MNWLRWFKWYQEHSLNNDVTYILNLEGGRERKRRPVGSKRIRCCCKKGIANLEQAEQAYFFCSVKLRIIFSRWIPQTLLLSSLDHLLYSESSPTAPFNLMNCSQQLIVSYQIQNSLIYDITKDRNIHTCLPPSVLCG